MKESVKKYQIQIELEALLPRMQNLIQMINDAEDIQGNHYDRTDPDDMYLWAMSHRIANRLEDAEALIKQSYAVPIAEGPLVRGENGKYFLNDIEIREGEAIDYLHVENGISRWIFSRIEHSGSDYFVLATKHIPLDGLHVRIKRIR